MLLPTKKKIFFLCRRDKCNILLYIFSYNNNHIMKHFFRSFLLINQSFFLCVIFDSSSGFWDSSCSPNCLLLSNSTFQILFFPFSIFQFDWKIFECLPFFVHKSILILNGKLKLSGEAFAGMKKFGNERLNLRLKFAWNLFWERPYLILNWIKKCLKNSTREYSSTLRFLKDLNPQDFSSKFTKFLFYYICQYSWSLSIKKTILWRFLV